MRKNQKSKKANVAFLRTIRQKEEATGDIPPWGTERLALRQAMHLSSLLGLLQEPSNWSLHHPLLHPPAAMHSDWSLYPHPLCARPGWLPERARDDQSPVPAGEELKVWQQRQTFGSKWVPFGSQSDDWGHMVGGQEDTGSGISASSPATY